MNGGSCEKSVDPGRDIRRSFVDDCPVGEVSCGEGVSVDGVSTLDGGLFNATEAEDAR
jgi:hypothetical protein